MHKMLQNFNPLKTGIIGSIIAALCCFTPALVILLGAIGLGWLAGFFDYILFPVLFIFLGLTAYGLYRQRPNNLPKS